jgi:hypothetical protein
MGGGGMPDLVRYNELKKTIDEEIKFISSNQIGELYFKAKFGKAPIADDLFSISSDGVEHIDRSLGGIYGLVDWLNKTHNNKIKHKNFIMHIEKLCGDSNEAKVKIIDEIALLRHLYIFEKAHKKPFPRSDIKTFHKLLKEETKKHVRKYGQVERCLEKIAKYLSQNIIEEAKVAAKKDKSAELLNLEQLRDYGLIWVNNKDDPEHEFGIPVKQKHTKGYQSLRRFICKIYEVAKEHSRGKASPNKPYGALSIAKILNFLEIKTESEEGIFEQKNIEQYIKRHCITDK